jgi:selenide,water dikinase
MVAIGEVDPARMVTNAGARPGDVLVLTKPLGSGIVATAVKAGTAPASVVDAAVACMATLNRGAADAMVAHGVSTATDVTGFGLLGHLRSMLRASGLSARIRASDVPALEGVRGLIEAGHIPGGTRRNLQDLVEDVTFAAGVDDVTRTLLADAQTSGGLLMAVPPSRLGALLEALEGAAPVAAAIGVVEKGTAGRIEID